MALTTTFESIEAANCSSRPFAVRTVPPKRRTVTGVLCPGARETCAKLLNQQQTQTCVPPKSSSRNAVKAPRHPQTACTAFVVHFSLPATGDTRASANCKKVGSMRRYALLGLTRNTQAGKLNELL